MMKAGLVKIVHEVRKNAGIHSKVPIKTVPAVCVGACTCTCMCDEVIVTAVILLSDLSCFYSIIVHALAEICQAPCVNGTCDVNTGYCDCDPGFTGLSCSEGGVVTV